MAAEPTVGMENPPSGTPRNASSDQLDNVDANLRLAISAIGSAGAMAGEWVGVSIHALFVGIKMMARPTSVQEVAVLALHQQYNDPGQWWSVHGSANEPIMADMRAAEQEGWITIEHGYAFPTQKLAGFLNS